MRPIRPTDSEGLKLLHRGLSSNTVYQRFFYWLDELTQAQADRFAGVDGVERQALVATRPDGDIVGVARYNCLEDPKVAEVAFVIADSYQHQGLGTALVRLLAEEARRTGIQTFVADVLSANRAMQHAFTDAGLVARATFDHGVGHLVMDLHS